MIKNYPKTIIFIISIVVLFFGANSAEAALGYLKLVTKATGGDGTFDYNIYSNTDFYGNPLINVTIATSNGTGSTNQIGVPINNYLTNTDKYRIITKLQIGWVLNYVDCNFFSEPQIFNINWPVLGVIETQVSVNKTSTCIFYYTKIKSPPGTLRIEKNTTGGDDTFNYNISPTPTTLSVLTSNGKGFKELPIEDTDTTYSIVETFLKIWDFNSASCNKPYEDTTNGVVGVTVLPNETTTCTFNNTKNIQPLPTGLKIMQTALGAFFNAFSNFAKIIFM